MSTDEKITRDLIQTLEDGMQGFAKGAERLADSERADLSTKFREYSVQRESFASELKTMAAQYGDHIDEDGTIAGAAHRGWMAFKDMLAGSDPEGVLDVAEQGEDHAVSEFQKALDDDISTGLRAVVERQFAAIQSAHDDVRALRNSQN